MNKILITLAIFLALAACQPPVEVTDVPPPAPTMPPPTEELPPNTIPAPTAPALVETLAATQQQVQGIWYNHPNGVFLELRGTGGAYLYKGLGNLFVNTVFTFEAGKFTWGTDANCTGPATYEVYILEKNGETVGLRMNLVGADDCGDRRNLIDGAIFQCVSNPPRSCNTP